MSIYERGNYKREKAVIRIHGHRGEEVEEIAKNIREIFGKNAGSSRIILSNDGGSHTYITVYAEAA